MGVFGFHRVSGDFEKKVSKEVKDTIERVTNHWLKGLKKDFSEIESLATLSVELRELRDTIADHDIVDRKKQWEWEKERLEVEHAVGLQKGQQEFEMEKGLALQEIELEKEKLKMEREKFKFETDSLSKKFDEIKDLMASQQKWIQDQLVDTLIQALPKATHYYERSEGFAEPRINGGSRISEEVS